MNAVTRKPRKQAAFLNIACGGVGRLATIERRKREQAIGVDIPEQTIILDTAPIEDTNELHLQLPLNEMIVNLLSGNRNRFGKSTSRILRALETGHRLETDQIQHGARTIRSITQLAMLYYRTRLLDVIEVGIERLLRKYAPKTIVPFIYSSSGGGSGSGLQIGVPDDLSRTISRQRILTGLSKGILERPISMVVEPISYSKKAAVDHGDAILANSYAFRIESEALLQQSKIQTVFHIGYSNSEAIVLKEAKLAARVMAETIVELQRSYNDFKDRWVDSRGFAAGRKANVENSIDSRIPHLVRKRG